MSNATHSEVVLAGALAAFTVDLLIYPLDTLKTRIQSQDFLKIYAPSSTSTSTSSSSSITQKQPLPRASAFRGLYQGVGIVILATLPASGAFFTVYESSKDVYARILPSTLPQPLIHSLASGTAELASCLVLTPTEVIKQNAQMLQKEHTSTSTSTSTTRGSTSLQAFRMLSSRAEGGGGVAMIRRLWTGYTALAARNLPFTAMQFPMFEALRARIWRWREDGRRRTTTTTTTTTSNRQVGGVDAGQGLLETGVVNGLSAAASGAIAATITTPTDVVKTRMMLLGGNDEGGEGERAKKAAKKQQRGGLDVARQVYRERGLRGLFRGGLLRAGWTAVGSGLYLGTYEVAKVWLKEGKKMSGEEKSL